MFAREAIILAGGKGTRLKEVIKNIPKSMAPINGRPLLEYLMDDLLKHQIDHLILSVGYKKESIMDHFGATYQGVKVDYAIEDEPLGTGGAIKLAFQYVSGKRALVLNGDTLFKVDFDEFFSFHEDHLAEFSLALKSMKDTYRYGAVVTDNHNRITGFFEKGKQKGTGLINGGVYLINKELFSGFSFPAAFSLEKDCLETQVESHNFYGMECTNYFLDIGIPADYQKAQNEFKRFKD